MIPALELEVLCLPVAKTSRIDVSSKGGNGLGHASLLDHRL
jgi:hypothetical protein